MNEKELATLRAEMITALDKLPQRSYIDDADVDVWVNTVLNQEPERAWWHYNRLFGIGGSEIGVLLGAEAGQFHPFSSARDITRQKLMVQGLSKPNGDMARGTQMEPVARDIYRARVTARGGKAILDDELATKLGAYKDPKHPWLVGNPDDIVEENGKVYIVDYKVPMPDQIKHYDHDGVPFYYEAQLHHYKLIAEKVGLKIDGLRLASLDLKNWDIDERDVPFRAELAQQILDVGDRYWNQFVLAGRVAPMIRLLKSSTLDELTLELREDLMDPDTGTVQITTIDETNRNTEDVKNLGRVKPTGVMDVASENLREELKNRVEKFNAWRNLAIAAGEMSDVFGEAIQQILPVSIIPPGLDKIDANVAQISVERDWNAEAVKNEIRRLGVEAGHPVDLVNESLTGANFVGDPKFDAKKLVESVKAELGVDVRSDPRFAGTIAEAAQPRMDTLISLLRELDVKETVDWTALMTKTPEVRVTLAREPFTGPLNDHRKELRTTLLGNVAGMVNGMASQVAQERALISAALNASKPPKKSRKAATTADTVFKPVEPVVAAVPAANPAQDLAAVFDEQPAAPARRAARKPK